MNIPKTNLPRLVIIGGGFAGLKLARNINHNHLQVVMIDRNNYHTFQPLMYQVATAGLAPDSIAYPLRKTLKNKKHTHIRMTEVRKINPDDKVIDTSIGKLKYDYLVIATGAVTNYFGNDNIAKHAMPMKNLIHSLDLRSMILQNFEKSLTENDLQKRQRNMNFVIVGGGPTGVELAGALAELKKHILPSDYPDLDIRRMQIHLLEADPKLLNMMSNKASRNAEKYLKSMDVNVWTNTFVEDYNGEVVKTSKDNFHTKTLIWAAGVKASFPKGLEKAEVKGGRLVVDAYNRLNGYDNIFAVGDAALMTTEAFPNGLPMLASVAQQQGKHLARNIVRLARDKEVKPFTYKDKGVMATIGRNKAVVDFKRFKFGGFFAWITWMAVHLMLLVEFRNRMVVFVNWLWSYIKFDKGTRLIIREYYKDRGSKKKNA